MEIITITDWISRCLGDIGIVSKRISIRGRDDYDRYLRSWSWRARRKAALKRAGYRCKKCGAEQRLNVHHKSYEHLGKEPQSDLDVLCRGCHKEEHNR